MNGPHDSGGRHGFGPLAPEVDEPLFHADWEPRAMALTIAAGASGHWTLDEARFARENRPPVDYYTLSYYQIWFSALERLLIAKGLVTQRELAAGQSIDTTVPPRRKLAAAEVAGALARGGPVNRDPQGRKPKFAVGDRVKTLNLQPAGHIRLPSYAREKSGVIGQICGFHLFADTSATGDHETAHWLYTVIFDAQELWGAEARAGDDVTIDAWEPYLEAN